jgi:hypothetical protein
LTRTSVPVFDDVEFDLLTADMLILLLLQFIASSMRRTVPKIAVKFAIPIESTTLDFVG